MAHTPTHATAIADLYLRLARHVIDHPDWLEVSRQQLPASVAITARAHRSDHGKLLGAGGKMFRALRTLLTAAGDRHGCAVHLVLEDPTRGTMGNQLPFRPDRDWQDSMSDELAGVLSDTCTAVWCECRVEWRTTGPTSTSYTVHCEPPADVRTALETWFLAAGKTMGRIVFLDFSEAKDDREASKQGQTN